MKRTLSLSALLSFAIILPAYALTTPLLVAQWGFDEATGLTLVDSTSKGHDGTLINGAERTMDRAPTGISNLKALHVNGTSAVTAPHATIENHSFSITGWLKSDADQQTNQVWFSQGDIAATDSVLALRLLSNNSLQFSFGNDDLTSPPRVFTSGTWHHVAFTFDANTRNRSISVDGNTTVSGTSSGVYLAKTGLVNLGRLDSKPFGSEYWHGSIDGVRIYDQALTTTDIAAMAIPVSMASSSSSSVRSTTTTSSAPPRYYQTMSRTDRLVLQRSQHKKTVVRVIRRQVSSMSSSSSSSSSMVWTRTSQRSMTMSSASSQMSVRSAPDLRSPISGLPVYQVTSFQLHLRKDSRATAVNIVTLMPYTKLTVLEMLKNGWAKVQTMDGTTGYVNASFIEKLQ